MRRLLHVLNNVFHQEAMSLDFIHSLLDVNTLNRVALVESTLAGIAKEFIT